MVNSKSLILLLRTAGVSLLSFLRYAAYRFATRQTLRVAASLSYTSLLALVPLVAIGVAVLSAFPVFEEARNGFAEMLLAYVAPHAGGQVEQYLHSFVDNTAQLTTIGVVGLGVTALLLLATIEGAFNVIWGVTETRPLVTRLIAFWTTLTLGPVLLGAGMSLSGALFAASVSKEISAIVHIGGVLTPILPAIPTAIGLTVIYVVLPARKVEWLHALAGGLVAALLFEVLKRGFGIYIEAAGSFTSIYGPLAALPLFLMWMYFTWAVVLLGAVIAASLPEWQALSREAELPVTPARQLRRAIRVLQLLRDAGDAGHGLSDAQLLPQIAGGNVALGEVLGGLRDHGYIARTENNLIVLARDLDGVTLHDVGVALELDLGDTDTSDMSEIDWESDFDRIVTAWRDASRAALNVPVKTLLESHSGGHRDAGDRPVMIAGQRPAGE